MQPRLALNSQSCSHGLLRSQTDVCPHPLFTAITLHIYIYIYFKIALNLLYRVSQHYRDFTLKAPFVQKLYRDTHTLVCLMSVHYICEHNAFYICEHNAFTVLYFAGMTYPTPSPMPGLLPLPRICVSAGQEHLVLFSGWHLDKGNPSGLLHRIVSNTSGVVLE